MSPDYIRTDALREKGGGGRGEKEGEREGEKEDRRGEGVGEREGNVSLREKTTRDTEQHVHE